MSIEAYDRTAFYNELYIMIDDTLHAGNEGGTGENTEGSSEDATGNSLEEGNAVESLSQETLDYYMSIEPSCSFLTEAGREYRMIAVDRALGSSFFGLIGTDDGESCSFVNLDPYNGSGGEAKCLSFVDEDLGFSCLSHSGGTYGSLYRTTDGGQSWDRIEYPSAKAKLPDGTYYNPFVMPESVYAKEGLLFLEVGQGADGDYYEEQGYCHGLYRSSDRGLNWEFVEKVYINR